VSGLRALEAVSCATFALSLLFLHLREVGPFAALFWVAMALLEVDSLSDP
jgi:hypothetical protein